MEPNKPTSVVDAQVTASTAPVQTNIAPASASTAVISAEDQKIIDEMKELSGENSGGRNYIFIPIITVNNAKEEEKEVLVDGVIMKVTPHPKKQFNIVNFDKESGEYVSEAFSDIFNGVILKLRYAVEKKFEETPTMEWFRSYEFDSFSDNVQLFKNKEVFFDKPYKDFKAEYAEKYVLFSILYVLVGSTVYRLKTKGESRAAVWEYMVEVKKSAKGRSISSVTTLFGVETNTEKQVAYNYMTVAIDEQTPVNLREVLNYQKELTAMLYQPKATKVEAEVVTTTNGTIIEGKEVSIDDVSFKTGDEPLV